jgi:hypothetical protein
MRGRLPSSRPKNGAPTASTTHAPNWRSFVVDQEESLAIPRNSLLRLGDDKIVFVQSGEGDGHVHFKQVKVDVDEGEESPWLVVKKGLGLPSR